MTSDAESADAGADAGPETVDAGVETPIELVWTTCDTSEFPDGFPLPARGVECTSIDAPVAHADPAGATLTLRVARHKSNAFPSGKAVFQLAGGPGGSAVAQSGIVPRYMPRLRDTFDLVYVDRRGTGGSGYLNCSRGYPGSRQEWEACAAEHTQVDLDHYLTVDAAHDLELVRRRLGYDRIYLRGGSYGTRLGLEYMRLYGERVVAAALDGLAPPNFDHFGELIRNIDASFDRLIADCAASAACLALSPSLEDDLVQRRRMLHDTPRAITVGGTRYREDEWLFIDALVAAVWDSYWRYRVPRAVHEAMNGDNTRWNGLLSELYGTTVADAPGGSLREAPRAPRIHTEWRGQSYVAPGLYLPVVCAEWLGNSDGIQALRALSGQQRWGNDVSGVSSVAMAEACAAWNVAPIDAALRQRVESSVPTLLMSGELDFNTRPAWGEDALLGLSHGTHLVLPFTTHSTMAVPCGGQIITDFLAADGDLSQVDRSCIANLREPTWE